MRIKDIRTKIDKIEEVIDSKGNKKDLIIKKDKEKRENKIMTQLTKSFKNLEKCIEILKFSKLGMNLIKIIQIKIRVQEVKKKEIINNLIKLNFKELISKDQIYKIKQRNNHKKEEVEKLGNDL